MAKKETAAQREARFEAERDAKLAVAKATYTERLMAVLERATAENFDMVVVGGRFKVVDCDDPRNGLYFVESVWSTMADTDLFMLDMAVEEKEEARREKEERSLRRTAALMKLTAEEREVLGL
jgi:hypothetical protein